MWIWSIASELNEKAKQKFLENEFNAAAELWQSCLYQITQIELDSEFRAQVCRPRESPNSNCKGS